MGLLEQKTDEERQAGYGRFETQERAFHAFLPDQNCAKRAWSLACEVVGGWAHWDDRWQCSQCKRDFHLQDADVPSSASNIEVCRECHNAAECDRINESVLYAREHLYADRIEQGEWL